MSTYLPDVLDGNGADVRWTPSLPGSAVTAADVVREDEPFMALPPRF